MAISNDEMKKFMYDPARMQRYILQQVETSTKGKVEFTDATNPFVLAIEVAANTAANTIIEMRNVVRKKYPDLANTTDDLYHHITDTELLNIYSTPSEALLMFYVNIISLTNENGGYRPEGENYVETTIPTGTEIKIYGHTFTLLNNIVVKLYDNGTTFVEQQLSDNSLAYDNISILDSKIVTDKDSGSWIVFNTLVKQVKRHIVDNPITPTQGFTETISIENKFCYAEVYYSSSATGNKKVKLQKAISDEYLNATVPTAVILPYNKDIIVKIPDIYLLSGDISGVCHIELYETRGQLYLPLTAVLPTDIEVTLGDTGQNLSTASSANVGIMVLANTIVNGGKNGLSTTELRESIINNLLGNSNLPITEKQLEQVGVYNGYSIFKDEDVITGRVYSGMKALPDLSSETDKSSTIQAKADVFFNSVKLVISEVAKSRFVSVYNNSLVVKSGTIFKDNNGVVEIVTETQYEALKKMSQVMLIEHLKANTYYYTPYTYVIEGDETFSSSRAYSLDIPEIEGVRILSKNDVIKPKANIEMYAVIKTDKGYRIILTVIHNDDYNIIEDKHKYLQLKLPLYNGTGYVYINSTYDVRSRRYSFDLETNFVVDDNDMIDLQNGTSNTSTKRIKLTLDATIYTIITDKNTIDPNGYLLGEIDTTGKEYAVVVTKETLTLKLGKKLDNLYNKLYNVYNEHKYVTHKETVYDTYDQDEYERKGPTGSMFSCFEDENGEYKLKWHRIHKKGDYKYDKNGDKVIKYKKGDPVIGKDGNPTINTEAGIIRHVDMLLLEYAYMATDNANYIAYREDIVKTLDTYIFVEVPKLNSMFLENTKLLYKSFLSNAQVTIMVNSQLATIPSVVTPKVLLYLKNTTSVTSDTVDVFRMEIGIIINKHLQGTTIILEDIKNEIKAKLGETVGGVKLTGIGIDNDEVINIYNPQSRLCLGKLLDLNSNNELIVKYNITIETIFI